MGRAYVNATSESKQARRFYSRYEAQPAGERSLTLLAKQIAHERAAVRGNAGGTTGGDIVRAGPKVKTVLGHLEEYSSKWHWQERVRAYDAAQRAEAEAARHAAVVEMNERHALLGRTQALRAIRAIEDLLERGRMGGQSAVQLLKIATDLERVAMGAPSTITRAQVQEQTEEDANADLSARLADDPIATDLARQLWERLGTQGDVGRDR